MLNTYINDNSNVPYPFYGLEELPFSLNCIVGMHVAIIDGLESSELHKVKLPLYVSTVNVKENQVSVSLCDSNDILLCTIDSANKCSIYDANMLYGGKSIVTARLHIGTYTKDSIGTFTGKFWIDPSCITLVPTTVYGNYTSMSINGVMYPTSDTLNIDISGLTYIDKVSDTSAYIKTKKDAADMDLCDNLMQYEEHQMVSTINGVSVRTKNTDDVAVLKIAVSESISDINIDSLIKGSTIVCAVNGTSAFPSCYTVDKDEASEAPCYEC